MFQRGAPHRSDHNELRTPTASYVRLDHSIDQTLRPYSQTPFLPFHFNFTADAALISHRFPFPSHNEHQIGDCRVWRVAQAPPLSGFQHTHGHSVILPGPPHPSYAPIFRPRRRSSSISAGGCNGPAAPDCLSTAAHQPDAGYTAERLETRQEQTTFWHRDVPSEDFTSDSDPSDVQSPQSNESGQSDAQDVRRTEAPARLGRLRTTRDCLHPPDYLQPESASTYSATSWINLTPPSVSPPLKRKSEAISPSSVPDRVEHTISPLEWPLPSLTLTPGPPTPPRRDCLSPIPLETTDYVPHSHCDDWWELPAQKQSKLGEDGLTRRVRKPFADEASRRTTALTRQLKACNRCKRQKVRCEPQPDDPHGPCLTCIRLTDCTAPRRCMRVDFGAIVLYRHQTRPFHSNRWPRMEIEDLTTWATDEIFTIKLSHIYIDMPYEVRVRRYIPIEGDQLEKKWKDSEGRVKSLSIPPYAIVDMKQAIEPLVRLISYESGRYISATVKDLDMFILGTYKMAFDSAKGDMTVGGDESDRRLLVVAFRLWAACRLSSNPEHVSEGGDRLGIHKVDDLDSPYHGFRPIPPMIIAQQECILHSTILTPTSKAVLTQLDELIAADPKKHWLAIYLAMFLLLHSCSMTIRRDAEYAAQIGLNTTYANPQSIEDHCKGAWQLLRKFHAIRGRDPFAKATSPAGLQEIQRDAGLSQRQLYFVRKTAKYAQDNAHDFAEIKREGNFANDFYWFSQLFEEDWTHPC